MAFVFLVIVVFLVPKQALADPWGAVATILGAILMPIISLIGKLITVMIRLLVAVAQYNDFIASPAVSKGWIIIRDIFNMFFIFILLIIAFGTVLKIEKYSYKRLLLGFLLAAVLVNFSKLICGIFIDIAQIIMLTFVNAFKSVGEGNLAELLGLRALMDLRHDAGGGDLNKELVGALCLGFIMSAIALVVVTIITLIFVFRIVILWFLVLLSPLAFMGSVLPAFQRYANQWWEKFASQVIIGPVLAFFLWLSFAMVQEPALQDGGIYKSVVPSGSPVEQTITEQLTPEEGETPEEGKAQISAAVSEAGKPQNVLNFIIGIAMLLGSLMVAQQMGVAGGEMAGQALAKIQAIGAGAAKAPFKAIGKAGKFIASEGIKELEARTGIPLTKTRWKKITERRKELSEQKREAEWAERKKGALSYLPKGTDEWAHVLHLKGGPKALGRFFQGIAGKAGKYREEAAGLIGENEKTDVELKSKISDGNYKKLGEDIKEKEKEGEQTKLNAETFKVSGTGTMSLNNIDEYLKDLEQKIKQWEKEKDPKAEQASKFAENLKKYSDQAKEDGKNEVDLNKIETLTEKDKSFYKQDVSEWFVQKTESTEKNVKTLKEQQEKYNFTKDDQDKINKQLQDLTGEITKIDIGDEAKTTLQALVKEMETPFEGLVPEKRKKIAEKVWNFQNKIKELKQDGKIDDQQEKIITDPLKNVHSRLNREIIGDDKMKEINEKRKKNQQDIHDLKARAEMIQPKTMTPEQKQAIHRRVINEYEKLKDNDDPQELITLYHRAEIEKDTALARAVLMKLNAQYDLNEILGDLNYEQGFRGEAKLAKRLHEKVGMDEQEAYMFINDLAYKNKAAQAFRFMAPVTRDQKTGLYRPTTDEEHEKIVLTETGKMDPENFYRRGWWGEIFCKTTDPQTGERIPVVDSTTMEIIKRDIDIIHKEMCVGFRFQKELEKDFAHPKIVEALEEMKKGLRRDQQIKMDAILNSLKSKQRDFWPQSKL